MPQTDPLDLLRRLCNASGPPGAEDEVRSIVLKALQGCGEVSCDRLGSLLCEKPGRSKQPRVMLDSHMDEVGFMVQSVSANGQIAFVPLGGWWGHVLLGQRVRLLTDCGPVAGIIGATPPHFLKPEQRRQVLEIEAMSIDIGASNAEQVAAAGVRVGDPIVPDSEFRLMDVEKRISGKALDNRIGVAVMCETLCRLRSAEHPSTVIGVAAVQEEVGARGAETAARLARPDVAIILECTPAEDRSGGESQASLGAGPQLRYYDPTAISNRRMLRWVESVAEQAGLPLQLAVRRGGGTDAGAVHRYGPGCPTVVIGVPARYIHTHAGIFDLDDYNNTLRLVYELVTRLDHEIAAEWTRFELTT